MANQHVPLNPFKVDSFANHFLINDPGNLGTPGYDTLADFTLEWFAFGWHGPYFNKSLPDPWGNAYKSNVFALHSVDQPLTNINTIYTSAVIVLSAGPNERFNTPYDMYYIDITKSGNPGPGYTVGTLGNDDQACVLSAGGPF